MDVTVATHQNPDSPTPHIIQKDGGVNLDNTTITGAMYGSNAKLRNKTNPVAPVGGSYS